MKFKGQTSDLHCLRRKKNGIRSFGPLCSVNPALETGGHLQYHLAFPQANDTFNLILCLNLKKNYIYIYSEAKRQKDMRSISGTVPKV